MEVSEAVGGSSTLDESGSISSCTSLEYSRVQQTETEEVIETEVSYRQILSH